MKRLLCLLLAGLMPDILLHQTLEDWTDGKDTVLEAVRKGKLPRISSESSK